MKIIQQFDLNFRTLKEIGREMKSISQNIEEFVMDLSREGYIVLKSTANFMGIPQSITLIKDTTSKVSSTILNKTREDFSEIANKTGLGKLFD